MDPRLLLSQKLPTLSDAAIALAYQLICKIDGNERLADFIRRVSPHHPPPAHVQPLIAAIERARWQPVRLCVSMPPRHCKTSTILHGLAWWLSNSPADTCAYVSYSDRQAWSKSRVCRALADVAGVRALGDSGSASEWRTREGGGLIAAGAMSGITGQGVHGLMVVDDPYKNREESDSEIIREKIWETFNEVVFTRLEGASVIVCHTRWGEDDVIARLVEMGWEYINLAALAEEGDPLGRQAGEALWPDNPNFTAEQLAIIRKQIGEWSFDALYQGRPTPKGMRLFYGPPRYYDPKDPALNILGGARVLIGCDPAASAKTTADYTAAVALAVKPPWDLPTVYVLDVYRKQVEVPQQARDLLAFQRRNYRAKLWVESVGGFKAVPQLIRDLAPGVLVGEINPRGDKKQRAERFASAWNDGRVLLPKTDPHSRWGGSEPPWIGEYVKELQRFTGKEGRQDDQVDASSNAFNQIAGVGRPVFRGAVYAPDRWA